MPKLKNLAVTEGEIDKHYSALKIIEEIKKLEEIATELSSIISYIVPAGEKLPPGNKVREDIEEGRQEFLSDVLAKKADLQNKWMAELKKLKEEYIKEYMELHKKYRLDTAGDQKKKKIMNGEVFKCLRDLSDIDMLERGAFNQLLREKKCIFQQDFAPCTLQELEESFKNFIQEKVKGKEKERGRIVIF